MGRDWWKGNFFPDAFQHTRMMTTPRSCKTVAVSGYRYPENEPTPLKVILLKRGRIRSIYFQMFARGKREEEYNSNHDTSKRERKTEFA